jgi:hypothetical protein
LGKHDGSAIFMTTSIQAANVSPATECGYVQAACGRLDEVPTSEAVLLEPPTRCELEEALGEPVKSCELWEGNWRNRVYRLELARGGAVVAKQMIIGTDAKFQCEYDQLGRLAGLQIPRLRLPQVLALLPAKRTYVMELAPGKTIPTLVWDRKYSDDLPKACELAGKILAGIHLAWTQKICSMPIDALVRDLAATPWHLSSREEKILQSAFERFARAEVRMGQVYYDYKPANFLFKDEELFLIDPPAVLREGVQLWDFSIFRGFMRRELWKFSLRRPFDRRRAGIRQAMAAFEHGYLANVGTPYPKPGLFASVVRFFELQRTAVLMTLQKGKVDAARQKMPIAGHARLGNPLANRITLPLLEMEKRWLFRRLARELPR